MQQTNLTKVECQPQLLYSKKVLNKASSLLEYSHQSRKQFQQLVASFQKRIDIQVAYAKSLQQLSKQLDKFIHPGTQKGSSYVCSAFKVDNEQRAHQARQLAESIRTEIYTFANDMLKQQTATWKKMEKDVKKYNKDLEYYEENFEKAETNFKAVDKETQELIITKNIVKFTSQLPQQKKIKMIGKTNQSIKQKKQYEKAYLTAVKQYNDFIKQYKKEIQDILNQLQSDEESRIKLQSDCMRKLIVCEISMFKNVEYDLINISKQMETINPRKDIQHTIKQVLQIKQEKQITSQLVEKPLLIDNSLLSISLRKVQQDYFAWMVNIKKNKTLRSIVQQRWKYLHSTELKNSLKFENTNQKKQQPIQNNLNSQSQKKQQIYLNSVKLAWQTLENKQKVFQQPKVLMLKAEQQYKSQNKFEDFEYISSVIYSCWKKSQLSKQSIEKMKKLLGNNFNRIIAGIFIEEYRIQHQVMIEQKNVKTATQIVSLVLESCLLYDDVFTARNLIGLLFTFSFNDDKNIKKILYLQPSILQNKLWKMHDFWDASIFESTYQQMALFTVQKGETSSETVLRQKNIIFSQLASYCHYMIMLGISSKNVRLIVGRYCRLYQMTEEQNKDLSKMISNTYRQYKDMNANLNSMIAS